MKNLFNHYIIALAALFFVASCAPTIDDFEVRSSTADFSKYIAVGNSLSAGFADGGLYLEGQRVAFPNLIAAQMQQIGGGAFTSPFFNENQANGSGYIRLTGFVDGLPQTATVTDNLAIRGLSPLGSPLYTKYEGPEINNYGVPGMRLDLAFAPGFGSAGGNPYFERLLEGNDTETTYFGFTTARQHTFFSFWLGNNDVLGYAMNGAVAVPGNPTTTLTEVGTFTALYNNFINTLTSNDRKGIVATIPDVTSIPFFTTVTQPQLAAAVTAGSQGQVTNVLIQTKSEVRPATPEDLFILTLPRERIAVDNGFGVDPRNPIPDNMVLDRDEVAQVRERVNQYNAVIRQAAETNDLALVDMYAFFNQVRSGLVYSSIPFNTQFIRGNAFSLDGIHLTPIGNAVVANTFIEAINAKYNSAIPRVDITQYPGVRMPN